MATGIEGGITMAELNEIPVIERTYDVVLPSGRHGKVNCFDMNLATFCGGERYLQLEDTSWIKAKCLRVLPKAGAKQ